MTVELLRGTDDENFAQFDLGRQRGAPPSGAVPVTASGNIFTVLALDASTRTIINHFSTTNHVSTTPRAGGIVRVPSADMTLATDRKLESAGQGTKSVRRPDQLLTVAPK